MPLSIWSPAWARKPELLLIKPILTVCAEAVSPLTAASNAPNATAVSAVFPFIGILPDKPGSPRAGHIGLFLSIAGKPRPGQCDTFGQFAVSSRSARGLLAQHRVADAERLGIEQHEGGARDFLAAVDPGVIGAALDQHVAGFEL